MKLKSLLAIALVFCAYTTTAQSKILKLSPQTGSFKNFPVLPTYEKFTIEGEILQNIVWVEVDINESKSKVIDRYFWNRSSTNKGANFEVIITKELVGSAKYDFNIRTFEILSEESKKEQLTTLIRKVHAYLNSQVKIDRASLTIDKPNKVYDILNEILSEGTKLQRSRNGLKIDELSSLVKQELTGIDGIKIKRFFRRKSSEKVTDLTEEAKTEKVKYITALILAEITPFFNSELVQQNRVYSINEIETEKDRFTLPINFGAYTWTSSPDFNKIDASNSGVTPGVGITFPIARNFSIGGKKLPSMGISLGVLTSSIKDVNGVRMSTPGINLPVYAALGFNFLKVVRLNVGTMVVAEHKSTNVTKVQWIPTIGLAFELDAWIGIRK